MTSFQSLNQLVRQFSKACADPELLQKCEKHRTTADVMALADRLDVILRTPAAITAPKQWMATMPVHLDKK